MRSSATYALSPGWRVLLRDLGVAPGPLLRRAGLAEDLLSHDGPRVAPAAYHALWEVLEHDAGDAALPVVIARALSVEAFDPTLLAAICSADLAAAAERLAAFKPLLGPMKLSVERRNGLRLSLRWPDGLTPPRALALTELLFWVALARLATRAEVRPTQITAVTPPDVQAPYRDYAGVDVSPGAAWSVSFAVVDAHRPFLTANEGLWAFFEPELRRRLAELEAGASTEDRVRAALIELLPAGDATMHAVARKLAMSARTLQRHLTTEGTSFQGVLARTRESLARHYLERSRLRAGEIAFLLGYEDPNSFYRAFQAWTGRTPESLRAREGRSDVAAG